MSKSSDYADIDVFTLSDRSLDRWLDQQDAGLYELPDEREFPKLESASPRTSSSQLH